MEFLLFFIAIGASTIGAISGMGGGVIIKPVMDAVSGLSASTISYMSCCTVLTMAIVSYFRGLKNEIKLNYYTLIPLSLGGAFGGVIGKNLFQSLESIGNSALVQASILLAINIAVLLYTVNKKRIKKLEVKSIILSLLIGFVLGCMSSFLGIGGGPINIAVLSYFYSMTPKVTVKNSLFIILFSQLTSFGTTLISGVPTFNPLALTLMCIGGVCGAFIGAKCSKKLTEDQVDLLFMFVLISLIILGFYNVYNFI